MIATGHAPPDDPPWAAALRGHPRYVADPWRPGALDRVPTDGPILLLGTGLTAVDVALTLQGRGVDLIAMSRRGLMPLAHVEPRPDRAPPPPPSPSPPPPPPIGGGLAPLMRYVRRACASGSDWRATVDGLRPTANDIWRGLSAQSRERFMRHAARHWEVHRHRMAPPVAATVAGLIAAGQLRVTAGRVSAADPVEGGVAVTVDGDRSRVAAIVNCTGPAGILRHPLMTDLLADGAARGEPLGLGLDVDPAGRLVDAVGRPWPDVHVVGPGRRGHLWETTAVPEIRVQAEALATAMPL